MNSALGRCSGAEAPAGLNNPLGKCWCLYFVLRKYWCFMCRGCLQWQSWRCGERRRKEGQPVCRLNELEICAEAALPPSLASRGRAAALVPLLWVQGRRCWYRGSWVRISFKKEPAFSTFYSKIAVELQSKEIHNQNSKVLIDFTLHSNLKY